MALRIGQNDKFERLYTAKFRALAARFGEFVEYSRDLAGRDIGLHFVLEKSDGGEIVEPSLVWFQLKGVQTSSLSADEFNSRKDLTIRLSRRHLQFWYVAPEPTYLVLYVEATGRFFVTNIKQYVGDHYGDGILSVTQQTLTVRISKSSVLDRQSFQLIKQRCSVAAWRHRICKGEEFADIFFRDAQLIRRLSTAERRRVSIHLVLRKYFSKLRSEAYFIECYDDPAAGSEVVREHWQFMMPDDLSLSFPYINFHPLEDSDDDDFDPFDDPEWPPLQLPNGEKVTPDGGFEEVEYRMSVSLNDIGKAWGQTLEVMEKAGFVELNDNAASMVSVSVAPWHARDV